MLNKSHIIPAAVMAKFPHARIVFSPNPVLEDDMIQLDDINSLQIGNGYIELVISDGPALLFKTFKNLKDAYNHFLG